MNEYPKNQLEVFIQSWLKLAEPLTEPLFPVKLHFPKELLNQLEGLRVIMLATLKSSTIKSFKSPGPKL